MSQRRRFAVGILARVVGHRGPRSRGGGDSYGSINAIVAGLKFGAVTVAVGGITLIKRSPFVSIARTTFARNVPGVGAFVTGAAPNGPVNGGSVAKRPGLTIATAPLIG